MRFVPQKEDVLKIIRAGMYTAVRWCGAHGFRQSGISHCGALDMPALRIANLLVGNDANAPALEKDHARSVNCRWRKLMGGTMTGAGCEAQPVGG